MIAPGASLRASASRWFFGCDWLGPRRSETAMRRRLPWVTSLAVCAIACDGASVPSPTAPTQPPTLVATGPLLPFVERYATVTVGDIVRTQVAADDVLCYPPFYCKYFRVTVPRDGLLEVGLTHAPGAIYSGPTTPIDMWIAGSRGGEIWMEFHKPDIEAFSRIRATAGETYQIGVVSYELPGVTFQLRFLLTP